MPGVILTPLMRHMDEADVESLMTRVAAFVKNPEQGAATTVWAALAPGLESQGGRYLENCQVAAPAVEGRLGGIQPYAQDPAAAERLWRWSEGICGLG
jgi:hypothetical protein